ncbi:NADPH-dependent FMN reductase [Legionella gresilensis]|uniref:NADPH-dependent FMN reductase n=1 Tax=Legionella gresilensis TaxID=91823 RepID=UPI00249F94E4|nr:NAD(P)H-dependent oxidoreductase [Legionella gresilensis]
MTTYNIGVIVGSLRKGSWNRKLANVLISLAPKTLNLKLIEIDKLSLFNQDEESNPPKSWVEFKNQVKNVDGLLFVTPEYNRSIPGALKNALDIASRPYGQSAWDGKPGAVISTSPGAVGGFGSNQHLRQCFVFLNIPCMQQPEAYIGNVAKLFDDKNNIINEDTKKFLKNFIDTFAKWVKTNVKR